MIAPFKFQWDPFKDAVNQEKHGIPFARAARIFRGRHLLVADTRKEYGELRFVAIGQADGEVLTVVVTWREECIRIISARRANHNERHRFGHDDP